MHFFPSHSQHYSSLKLGIQRPSAQSHVQAPVPVCFITTAMRLRCVCCLLYVLSLIPTISLQWCSSSRLETGLQSLLPEQPVPMLAMLVIYGALHTPGCVQCSSQVLPVTFRGFCWTIVGSQSCIPQKENPSGGAIPHNIWTCNLLCLAQHI